MIATPSLSLPTAFARLVLVLAGSIGGHVSLTAPQPPARASERKAYGPSTVLEVILGSAWTHTIGKVSKYSIFEAVALCFG